jgi:hypothetical protein
VAPRRSGFQYTVVRIVPDVEREEFLNAGLILFARERRFLHARTQLDADALEALHPGCDTAALRSQLDLIDRVASGELMTGPFAAMDQSKRFHWLTTPRSTLVQPGPLHAGITHDPQVTFDHLWRTLVARGPSD